MLSSNNRVQISFSLHLQVYDYFNQIEINDNPYILFVVITTHFFQYQSMTKTAQTDFLIHIQKSIKRKNFFSQYKGPKPRVTFRRNHSLSSDECILYVHESIIESSNKKLERVLPQDREKATNIQ